jgi:hypothetical protein
LPTIHARSTKTPEKAIYIQVNIELEGIKMVSGQPQGQGQYPMYQPAYQAPHRSAGDMMKMFVSDTLLALIVFVGLLLAMIGSWMIGLMDPGSGRDLGHVLRSLGVTALVGGALAATLLRHDMDKFIRAALLLFATVLAALAFWMF